MVIVVVVVLVVVALVVVNHSSDSKSFCRVGIVGFAKAVVIVGIAVEE